MPTPSTVKIDGVDIADVKSVEFTYQTPIVDGGYLRNVTPHYGTIELSRLATDAPICDLFKLATNDNGNKKTFGGEITLIDTAGETTYSAVFENAFIEEWSVVQSTEDMRGEEVIVLRAGKLTFHAGTANKTVDFAKYLA